MFGEHKTGRRRCERKRTYARRAHERTCKRATWGVLLLGILEYSAPMQNRTISYAVLIIIVIILLLGGYYYLRNNPSPSDTFTNATSTQQVATSTVTATTSAGTISATSPTGEGYTISAIPVSERPEAPNYQRSLVFNASISADVRTKMNAQFAATKALLAKDSSDFNAWLTIGNLRLIAGDEAGAKEIWDYTAQVWPTNKVSFNNLGDYYTTYQKDFAKAEANYLLAIKNDAANAAPYRSLFSLYYTLGYNKSKGEGILKQGIAAVPKAVDLQVLLARYYRDTGRTAEAKAQYNLAITNAQSQGQTSLATTIQSELAAF